jgi:hypothetical protein
LPWLPHGRVERKSKRARSFDHRGDTLLIVIEPPDEQARDATVRRIEIGPPHVLRAARS